MIEASQFGFLAPPEIVELKRCTACGIQKPPGAFAKNAAMKDGLSYRCRECSAELSAEYYARNIERLRARSRERARANAEALREYNKNYRAANADKVREYYRAYIKTPSGRLVKLAKIAKRKALKRGGSLPRSHELHVGAMAWEFIKSMWGNACAYCGVSGVDLTRDHVVPVLLGGAHSTENIVPACLSCNSSKQAKPLERWLASIK